MSPQHADHGQDPRDVVITGIGLVTPLGRTPSEVLQRIGRGEVAASEPAFDASAFACQLCSPVLDFDADHYFPENKTLRLMNRDAQLAVVAARLAMQDAAVESDDTYPGEQIALHGATGLTSLPMGEVTQLIRLAAGQDGSLDLERFGREGLKRIRPVLSFKILANMPICFVSIFERIRGPNSVHTPWEGQGAQAIGAGIRAIRRGDVPCALIGGCDVQTHLLSFVRLQQSGVFTSWTEHGQGIIPGEGAAFLVLEDEQRATQRGARIHARIVDHAMRPGGTPLRNEGRGELRETPRPSPDSETCHIATDDGDVLHPKSHLGNLFAAAAAVQVALGAAMVGSEGNASHALVHCNGFGDQHGEFLLEGVGGGLKVSRKSRVSRGREVGVIAEGGLNSCEFSYGRMNRVVITGMGVVSPVGIGCDAFWANLTAGRSGIGPITRFDASAFRVRIGGEVEAFDTQSVIERFPQAAGVRDRKVFLGLAAAEQAVRDPSIPDVLLHDAMLQVGVGLEEFHLEDLTRYAHASDVGKAMARSILVDHAADHALQTPLDRTGGILGLRYGFSAGRYTNCSACAAGTQVIGEAWQMLREGPESIALVGATDSMLNPLGVGGFSLLRVLSDENDQPHRACRPFDVSRKGTVLGEGAAFLVMETLDHALARNATIHAEVLGYGSSMDAYRVSDPDPTGMGAVQAMRQALDRAAIDAEQVDCISAHGTGTPKNDIVETQAIKQCLGPRAGEIPVHAVKSMTGHLIAASGAVEAVAAVLTIRHRTVPPTINLECPDPRCDLDYVKDGARPFEGRIVLSNSFGFGGQNATVVFARYDHQPPTTAHCPLSTGHYLPGEGMPTDQEHPATEQQVLDKLLPLIEEVTGVPPERIAMQSGLVEDLGAESLDLLDLSFLIEETFNVTLAADEFEQRVRERIPDGVYHRDGYLTEEALAELKLALPEVPPEKLEPPLAQVALPAILNVAVFVHLVQRKLVEAAQGEADA